MTLGNLPRWLYPRVEDLLPFSPGAVWGRLGASISNPERTAAQNRKMQRAGVKALRALPKERRREIGIKAGTARFALLSAHERTELGRRGGLAYAAAATPRQKRILGRKAAAATNLIRWGFNG